MFYDEDEDAAMADVINGLVSLAAHDGMTVAAVLQIAKGEDARVAQLSEADRLDLIIKLIESRQPERDAIAEGVTLETLRFD